MKNLLGIDLGSSSIKVSLVNSENGAVICESSSPVDKELPINSPHLNWAEQDPQSWWQNTKSAIQQIAKNNKQQLEDVSAIGVSYQMHGLVLLDKDFNVLRPSIIWCDSRAVDAGEEISEIAGRDWCNSNLLNQPANFTLSKLYWVKKNEPAIYSKIAKFMLPGDYLCHLLTGEARTTATGLSEGILWNFKNSSPSLELLEKLNISTDLVPEIVPSIGYQGEITSNIAQELGLKAGTPITFRGGDQPVNAFSLNVNSPGAAAVNAGTSGVVYAVCDYPISDPKSRFNSFLHPVKDTHLPLTGSLLCINGTGIFNSWIRKITGAQKDDYQSLNDQADKINPGSDGLFAYPFGNGAERILGNKTPGASLKGLNFNLHTQAHLYRAVQESLAFTFAYGFKLFKERGLSINKVNAGNANMFLSPVFREIFSAVTGTEIKLFNTNGAQGAARGAGFGAGIFSSLSSSFEGLKEINRVTPDEKLSAIYKDLYGVWEKGVC